MKYENLFKPVTVAGVQIKNRFFMSPMFPFGMAFGDGRTTDQYANYYIERAKGGVGLIFTGLVKANNTVEVMCPVFGCVKDPLQYMQSTGPMVERIHAHGAKIFLQISAGWGRALWPQFAERLIGVDEGVTNRHDPSVIHEQITTEEVGIIIRDFAKTAKVAQMTGFDGIEVHAVHEGYLLDQFTTEFYNHRTDKYGGSFENRYRFAVEIVQTVKAVCGKDFPVSLRYSPKHFIVDERVGAIAGEDFVEKGRDMEEGLEAAKYLVKNGYDILNVDVGCYDSHYWSHPTTYSEDALYLPYAAAVKEVVDVPVLCSGRMDDPEISSKAIADGKIDMVGLGRTLLADPYYPDKLKAGKTDNIRWCINCNVGCGSRLLKNGHLGCAVNPTCGYEREKALRPLIGEPKNVVVVGGGPAGMEAAKIAAERGHSVVLFDKNDKLGGNLITASGADFKYRDEKLIGYFETELRDYGVDVRLETEFSADTLKTVPCDVLLLATGADAIVPNIPGKEKARYYSASEVLQDASLAGDSVAVIGGGQVGVETAIWLSGMGKQVTIIEMLPEIQGGPNPPAPHVQHHADEIIRNRGIAVMVDTKANEITGKGVIVEKEGAKAEVFADTVIYAVGYRSENKLFGELYADERDVYNIGDSATVGNVYFAVHNAYEVANNI